MNCTSTIPQTHAVFTVAKVNECSSTFKKHSHFLQLHRTVYSLSYLSQLFKCFTLQILQGFLNQSGSDILCIAGYQLLFVVNIFHFCDENDK